MRLALFFIPPLLFAAPFAACSTSSSTSSSSTDAGTDAASASDSNDELTFDTSFPQQEAATVTHCRVADADPVGLCVQKMVLQDLHAHAFAPNKGVAPSWNSTTQTPDTNEAGVVPYNLDDTVAYAAAAANYLTSAELYGDTSINSILQDDIVSIATQLESNDAGFSVSVPPTEYSGELYFHLRTVAAGLFILGLNSDAQHFNKFADEYGRSILTAHYFTLGSRPVVKGDAGGADGGHPGDGGHDAASEAGKPIDASHPTDSGHDATVDAGKPHDAAGPAEAGATVPDGIVGNKSGNQVAYSPADVATAAYALLDLVKRNPTDPSVPAWLAAVRASLGHLQARAIEPTTGMFYSALLASYDGDGGGGDTLATPTNPMYPNNALLADTQATFVLAMVRAQNLVTANTIVSLTGADGGAVTDAGVSGPFVPILDLPLEAWADATLKAMNGAHSIWDGTTGQAGHGYLDGYIPGADGGTGQLITTKSTRANAFMAAAIEVAFVQNSDQSYRWQLSSLVQLLVAQQSAYIPLHSNLITVLPSQLAYLRGATQGFEPLDSGPEPMSYTSAAVSAAVESLNQQLPPQTP